MEAGRGVANWGRRHSVEARGAQHRHRRGQVSDLVAEGLVSVYHAKNWRSREAFHWKGMFAAVKTHGGP